MARTVLNKLASLGFTFFALTLLALSTGLALSTDFSPTALFSPAFAALAVNLVAAIIIKDQIRRSTPLLVFHLSLLIILLLVMASRLTYLKGWVELTEGQKFEGISGILHKGPLHPMHTNQLQFTQGAFYTAFNNRAMDRTFSRVYLGDDKEEFVIRDQMPLILEGYRFGVSSHMGYAPSFQWQTESDITIGNINLPSYLYNKKGQALSWKLPGSNTEIWTMLEFDEEVIEKTFKKPVNFKIIARIGEDRHELSVGETLTLAEGSLTFVDLKQWIGYELFYDWTIPWLLAACMTAILSLLWFLIQKWTTKPWLQTASETENNNVLLPDQTT